MLHRRSRCTAQHYVPWCTYLNLPNNNITVKADSIPCRYGAVLLSIHTQHSTKHYSTPRTRACTPYHVLRSCLVMFLKRDKRTKSLPPRNFSECYQALFRQRRSECSMALKRCRDTVLYCTLFVSLHRKYCGRHFTTSSSGTVTRPISSSLKRSLFRIDTTLTAKGRRRTVRNCFGGTLQLDLARHDIKHVTYPHGATALSINRYQVANSR